MADFDGSLTPPAGWDDVPKATSQMRLLGGAGAPLNAQAEALAARSEQLRIEKLAGLSNYVSLRGYAGAANSIYVTGVLGSAKPEGIAGLFVIDATDITSADNGGTIIVDALGRRWKRQYNGQVDVMWFGAKPDWNGTAGTDNAAAFLAAVATGAAKIYGPKGIYYLSAGFKLGYGQGFVGDGLRERTKLVFANAVAKGIDLGDGGYAEKIHVTKVTAVKTGTGIDLDTVTGGTKWGRVRDIFIDNWDVGLALRNYYHTLDGIIATGNNTGIKIGDGTNFSGAVTLIGCHFRNNYIAGLNVAAATNTTMAVNCTWETNQTHIQCDGQLEVVGGYLGDPPLVGVTGNGTVTISGGAIFAGSDGTEYGKNAITTDYAHAIKMKYAVLSNITLGINEQIRSTPTPGTVIRGSVIGEGRYVLNNARLATTPTNDASIVLEQSATIKQQILNNGVPRKNYINNGLFLDRTSASNPLYISSSAGVDPVLDNPWGGGVVRMQRFGSKIRWTVPKQNIGRQHYLMIYCGVKGAAAFSGPGLDVTNSTNLTFDVTTPDVVQIGSKYITSPETYQLTVGSVQGARTFIGLSVVLVTPTTETGLIQFAFNAPDGTTHAHIHGIVMTERNEASSTTSEGWPIGWFETAEAALL